MDMGSIYGVVLFIGNGIVCAVLPLLLLRSQQSPAPVISEIQTASNPSQ